MEENLIKVYVNVDTNNVITGILSEVESRITGISIEGWKQIDEGQGNKYDHASGNYLEAGLADATGFNYKLVNEKPVALTAEEKAKLFPMPMLQLTLEQQLLETQALVANLQEQILLKSNGGI